LASYRSKQLSGTVERGISVCRLIKTLEPEDRFTLGKHLQILPDTLGLELGRQLPGLGIDQRVGIGSLDRNRIRGEILRKNFPGRTTLQQLEPT
jgi:hypothetical protein